MPNLHIRPLAALAATVLISGSSSNCAVARDILITDRQTYTEGAYGAYSAPWSTYPGEKNDHLVYGQDFQNYIIVSPDSFPGGTTIVSRWPDETDGGVLGYSHLYYGNYDGGRPEGTVTPRRVRDIIRFEEDVDYQMSGDVAKSTLLGEFYLTRRAGDEDAKAFEIGIFYQASDEAISFFEEAFPVGRFEDEQQRQWDVVNAGRNPAGAVYIIFALESRHPVSGHVDRKAMLDFLVEQKAISDGLWVNGIGLGLESHGGTSTLHIRHWQVDLF